METVTQSLVVEAVACPRKGYCVDRGDGHCIHSLLVPSSSEDDPEYKHIWIHFREAERMLVEHPRR